MGVPVFRLSRLKEIQLIDWVVITKLDEHEGIIEVLNKNGIDNNRIIDLRKLALSN
jgi:hypothetical protein